MFNLNQIINILILLPVPFVGAVVGLSLVFVGAVVGLSLVFVGAVAKARWDNIHLDLVVFFVWFVFLVD